MSSTTPPGELPVKRRVVFVVGSGRSGTSTMSGALQTLGMHVPQPEVQADDTNPKGFGEPQWVVDFHDELLKRCNVQVSDARPSAWFESGKLSTFEPLRQRLHEWLEPQFAEGAELVDQGPAAGVVHGPVALGGPALRRDAGVRHDAAAGDRGGGQQAAALRLQVRRGQPHRRLGQHDAPHRARHPRLGPRVRALRRPPQGLDGAGVRDRSGLRPGRGADRVGQRHPRRARVRRPRPAPGAADLGRHRGAAAAARDRRGELAAPRPAGRRRRRHPRGARGARRAAHGVRRAVRRGGGDRAVDRAGRPPRRPGAAAGSVDHQARCRPGAARRPEDGARRARGGGSARRWGGSDEPASGPTSPRWKGCRTTTSPGRGTTTSCRPV